MRIFATSRVAADAAPSAGSRAMGDRFDDIDTAVHDLLDRTPRNVAGQEREAAARDFVREAMKIFDIGLKEICDAVDWFNAVSCQPNLNRHSVDFIVASEFLAQQQKVICQ
jgi:hypothetical protein